MISIITVPVALGGLSTAVALFGTVSAVVRPRRMWAASAARPARGARLLGVLLPAYGLYVAYPVLGGIAG
ncbi:hypothetical protein [Streptomyces sp. NPDC092370]|uniref:hypothetical protein n=1 Tax=Streptomyces sp. NPDC092370 TaxID=3366016 RepID=UPI0038214023